MLSKGRDRIVGAIFVGAETGDALVERLKKNLDVDVALLLRGKVIASSRAHRSSSTRSPSSIAQHTSEIESVKRTPPLALWERPRQADFRRRAVPGQAGEQQAYYALIGVQPANTTLSLTRTTSPTTSSGAIFPGFARRWGGAGHRASASSCNAWRWKTR